MSTVRLAFDLDAPLMVACEELVYAGRTFVRGQAFPWQDLGIAPTDLLQLWTFFKLDVAPAAAVPTPAAPPAPAPEVVADEPRRSRRPRG